MPRFNVKPGVILPPVVNILAIVAEVMEKHAVECTITSGVDGKHKAGSLHYAEKALDFRTRSLNDDLKSRIATECRERLGPGYDFVIEPDHYHCEHQPK